MKGITVISDGNVLRHGSEKMVYETPDELVQESPFSEGTIVPGTTEIILREEYNSRAAYDLIRPKFFAIASANDFASDEYEVDIDQRYEDFFEATKQFTKEIDDNKRRSFDKETKLLLLQAREHEKRVYLLSECHITNGKVWRLQVEPKLLEYKVVPYELPF